MLAVVADPLVGQVGLRRLGHQPLAVGQHHRADRSGDEQGAGGLEREDVAREEDVGEGLDVAAGVGLVEPDHRAERHLAEADDEHQRRAAARR